MRDEDGCTIARVCADHVREPRPCGRVDTARRLVEHEQVGLGRKHGGQGESLALAAREIAWVAARVSAERDEPQGSRGGCR